MIFECDHFEYCNNLWTFYTLFINESTDFPLCYTTKTIQTNFQTTILKTSHYSLLSLLVYAYWMNSGIGVFCSKHFSTAPLKPSHIISNFCRRRSEWATFHWISSRMRRRNWFLRYHWNNCNPVKKKERNKQINKKNPKQTNKQKP